MAGFKGELVVRGECELLGIEAEAMPAIQAFQVVEIGIVELGAQCGSSFTAGHATRQAAKHCAGDAADSRACRAKPQANGRTNSDSTSGHGNATDGTRNRANRPADLAAMMQGVNAD